MCRRTIRRRASCWIAASGARIATRRSIASSFFAKQLVERGDRELLAVEQAFVEIDRDDDVLAVARAHRPEAGRSFSAARSAATSPATFVARGLVPRGRSIIAR